LAIQNNKLEFTKMNTKNFTCCILFFLSFSIKAQSDIEYSQEFEFIQIKGFHKWERTMLKILAHNLYQNPTSSENEFVKNLKIKTVRKYLIEVEDDSTLKERFQYEITYDNLGNLVSEKTQNYIEKYLYNDKGFLIEKKYKKIDNIPLYLMGSIIHYKEQKKWSKEFPYSKLEKHIFLDSKNEIATYIKFSYTKNNLISKITHYNSDDKCSYFYSFEYEFYQ
jgi:YD repeat-containing protein